MSPQTLPEKEEGLGWHPYRVITILLIFSFTMVFAGWTSAYIVRRDEGNWREFELPAVFILSTIIVVLSSVTMQWAYYAAKHDEIKRLKMALGLTVLLGLGFLVSQWQAWTFLVVNQRTHFGGMDANVSGSFLYVLTGWHMVHIISSVIFVAVILRKAFNYQVHSRALLAIGNANLYWHFLTGLWLYLYLFLLLNH